MTKIPNVPAAGYSKWIVVLALAIVMLFAIAPISAAAKESKEGNGSKVRGDTRGSGQDSSAFGESGNSDRQDRDRREDRDRQDRDRRDDSHRQPEIPTLPQDDTGDNQAVQDCTDNVVPEQDNQPEEDEPTEDCEEENQVVPPENTVEPSEEVVLQEDQPQPPQYVAPQYTPSQYVAPNYIAPRYQPIVEPVVQVELIAENLEVENQVVAEEIVTTYYWTPVSQDQAPEPIREGDQASTQHGKEVGAPLSPTMAPSLAVPVSSGTAAVFAAVGVFMILRLFHRRAVMPKLPAIGLKQLGSVPIRAVAGVSRRAKPISVQPVQIGLSGLAGVGRREVLKTLAANHKILNTRRGW